MLADTVIELTPGDGLMARFFGPVDATTRAATPDLRCVLTAAAVERPTRPPDSTNGPIERWNEKGRVLLWHHAGCGVTVTDTTIELGAMLPEESTTWRTFRQLLAEAISAWFADRSLFLLHAAALGRDGRCLLALGPTGAGKSTTAIAALASGWDVYSDDLVVIRRVDERVECWGVPKPLMADGSLATELGLAARVDPDDVRERSELGHPPRAGWAEVGAVLLLDHADADAELSPAPRSVVLAAVAASLFEGAHHGIGRALPVLAGLASRPAFRLAHDRDASIRITRAAELLDEVLPRSSP